MHLGFLFVFPTLSSQPCMHSENWCDWSVDVSTGLCDIEVAQECCGCTHLRSPLPNTCNHQQTCDSAFGGYMQGHGSITGTNCACQCEEECDDCCDMLTYGQNCCDRDNCPSAISCDNGCDSSCECVDDCDDCSFDECAYKQCQGLSVPNSQTPLTGIVGDSAVVTCVSGYEGGGLYACLPDTLVFEPMKGTHPCTLTENPTAKPTSEPSPQPFAMPTINPTNQPTSHPSPTTLFHAHNRAFPATFCHAYTGTFPTTFCHAHI